MNKYPETSPLEGPSLLHLSSRWTIHVEKSSRQSISPTSLDMSPLRRLVLISDASTENSFMKSYLRLVQERHHTCSKSKKGKVRRHLVQATTFWVCPLSIPIDMFWPQQKLLWSLRDEDGRKWKAPLPDSLNKDNAQTIQAPNMRCWAKSLNKSGNNLAYGCWKANM